MDFELGEVLTRWSVRAAVACYLLRVFLDSHAVRTGQPARHARWARWLWTAGCGLLVVHVVCAFAFYHQWSHQSAFQHTADETAQVIGVRWGGGIYLNYAFTLLWICDVACWWYGDVRSPYRHQYWFWCLHVVFAFMVINATVVFGPPFWKWVAAVIGFALVAIYMLFHRE